MHRIMNHTRIRLCVSRLTSPEFHRSVSSELLVVEIQRIIGQLGTAPPLDTSASILTESLILLKHASSAKMSPSLFFALTELASTLRTETGYDGISQRDLVEQFFDRFDFSSFSSADQGRLVSLVLTYGSTGSFDKFISSFPDDRLFGLLQNIVSIALKSHETILPLIPSILIRILKISPTNMSAENLTTLVDLVATLRTRDPNLFRLITSGLMKMSSAEIKKIRPSTALKLVREMGWGGFTHSTAIARLDSSFLTFRNFQALTSVLLIGGGLSRGVVDHCMRVVREDLKRSKFPVTAEGHCQLIRRLVVCGYFTEAMELFRQFSKTDYLAVKDALSVSQIYRLYLASFLEPSKIDRSEVEFLRRDTLLSDVANHVAYDSNGVNSSNSSYIHGLVVNALRRNQIEHVSEYLEPKTWLPIDIYIPSLNLGIEVQGPSHYITDLETGEPKLRPEDEFKLAVLRSVDVRIETISIHDFGRNHATRNADKFIMDIINRFRV
jgi:hypothetical protein